MNLAVLAGLVTLSFQNVPVAEVGQVYEEVSGIRVMVHPEVQDTEVTVRAFRPLEQSAALKWIEESLRLEGIGFEYTTNSVVWRSVPKVQGEETREDAERVVFRFLPVSEFVEAITQAQSMTGIPSRVALPESSGFGINQASPLGMVPVQSTQIAPQASMPLSGSGIADVLGVRVVQDVAGNAVTFYGTKAGREALKKVALQMDVDPAMIELEVIIAEYALSDGQSAGVDWSQIFTQATDGLRLAGSIRGAGLADLAQVRSGASALYGGEGLTLYGQVGQDYSAVVQALSKLEDFRILQRPKLQTANHKAANIYVGERVPVPGRTVTETASVVTTDYLPVRLEVSVTPHLMEGGKIRLDFKQSKNDVTGFSEVSGNSLPNISEQGVQSIVVARDSETVFLGGLRTKRDTETVTGVPGLNRLPVLKYLFGSVKKGTETKEIVVFVRPKVGRGPVKAMDLTHFFKP
ncbi:hypothetical protein [Verrucomicrobium sp. BvORR034]|uniref:type II secretion system protein GspD n=1 Tax=Verrucomicrobium sp. BvORR034 TaxID=1396418 RepID=UPI000678AEEC|nr:hypothetical protein [Verrucomicrobium sp. BvORR034]